MHFIGGRIRFDSRGLLVGKLIKMMKRNISFDLKGTLEMEMNEK